MPGIRLIYRIFRSCFVTGGWPQDIDRNRIVSVLWGNLKKLLEDLICAISDANDPDGQRRAGDYGSYGRKIDRKPKSRCADGRANCEARTLFVNCLGKAFPSVLVGTNKNIRDRDAYTCNAESPG